MTIIRLQDNEFSKTPKLARVYQVSNVDYFLDIESENTILKAKIAELSK